MNPLPARTIIKIKLGFFIADLIEELIDVATVVVLMVVLLKLLS